MQGRRVFIIHDFCVKFVSWMKRSDVFSSVLISAKPSTWSGRALQCFCRVYMCCLFVYGRWPRLLISSTGALGDDHPRDPLQRAGRLTSGLARGGEERGSRVPEHVYILAARPGKFLHAHLTNCHCTSLFCLFKRVHNHCALKWRMNKIFVNSS